MEEIVCRPYGTLSRPIERSEPNESISLQSNLPPAAASPHRLENNADGSETTESGITGRKNPDLTCRHFIVGLSMIGATMAEAVSLYQVGMIEHLPDLPIPGFDSSRVDASTYAYKRFDTPDGFMMLTNYSITALLAAAGGKDRARQNPILPIALLLKTITDSAVALWLAKEEWQENEAFCAYCHVATVCSIVSVVLAVPEAMAATRYLLGKRDTETA